MPTVLISAAARGSYGGANIRQARFYGHVYFPRFSHRGRIVFRGSFDRALRFHLPVSST